jgi:hypothetical protein
MGVSFYIDELLIECMTALTVEFALTCKNCPLKGEDLGRDRAVCNLTGQVVRHHHKAALDCMEAVDKLGGEEDNRGSGRVARLLDLLQERHGGLNYEDELEREEFRLGLRNGLERREKIKTFHADSPYYKGYTIALAY